MTRLSTLQLKTLKTRVFGIGTCHFPAFQHIRRVCLTIGGNNQTQAERSCGPFIEHAQSPAENWICFQHSRSPSNCCHKFFLFKRQFGSCQKCRALARSSPASREYNQIKRQPQCSGCGDYMTKIHKGRCRICFSYLHEEEDLRRDAVVTLTAFQISNNCRTAFNQRHPPPIPPGSVANNYGVVGPMHVVDFCVYHGANFADFLIYHFIDRWSGKSLMTGLLYDAGGECSENLGHIFLDFIRLRRCTTPLQVCVETGEDTRCLEAALTSLRLIYGNADELNIYPPIIRSTAPEGERWKRANDHVAHFWDRYVSRIMQGQENEMFDPMDYVEKSLFFFVWEPIIQDLSQRFGAVGIMNGVPGLNKTFTSDPVAIQRLRSRLPPPKEGYSLQPRDAEEVQLKARMERAYERIGKPRRRVENAWNIFQQMLPHLEQ